VSDRPIAVAALVPRQRAVVVGEIQSVASFEMPWVRTDAVLGDGFVAGCRVLAQGTPGLVGDAVVMVNPLYSFATCE